MMRQKKRNAISIATFRCRGRKNCDIFNSFHKVLQICTLSIFCCITISQVEVVGQRIADSLQLKIHEIGDVIITAGRTPMEVQKVARIVSVITKSEITGAPVQCLNDLIRYVAGVDIRQRGPLGVQADISILGGTYDQTLILLNGVTVNDPQTGHHNLNLPVDIESIERIEILQGPAAKSFGPNAFSGAVNIITGNNKPNHIRVSGMIGQFGLYKTSANISNTVGRFSHFLSVNHMSSDGYIKNTDFANNNLFYQAEYRNKSGTFYLQTGYNKKDFGANSFYSLKYPNQYEVTKTEFISIKYQSNTFIKFAPTFYFRRNFDLFELKRDNDSVPFNHHQTNTAGLNLNVWFTHKLGKTSLGIDFRSENIMSNVLGNPLNIPVPVPGFDSAYYTKHYSRMNVSIYAEHSVSWNNLIVTAGIMAHHNTDMTGFSFYPGVDISYILNDHIRLYSSANKSLRMPTFTDMFYKSPIQSGNPGLKPEEAFTIEGGAKYNNSFINSYICLFRRWGYNMIDWVKSASPDSIIWRSMNHTRINFTGMECSIEITPPKGGRFERIRTLRLAYTFLKADSDRNNMLSKYALDYLSHQITSSIDFRIVWKLYNSARLIYHNRSGLYQDSKGQLVSYKPFWLCDNKFYWKEAHWTVFAQASNIFNTSYYDFGGIMQPGIWLMGGIVVDLDYRK